MSIYFPSSAALTYLREGMALSVSDKLGHPDFRPPIDHAMPPEFTEECKNIVASNIAGQGSRFLAHVETNPRTVLDIGCGLGIFSLSLYHTLNEKPTLYMVDGDSGGAYMTKFTDDGRDLVTDIDVTADFMLGNGVHPDHMALVPPCAEVVSKLPPMDLVVSNYSWFYHYPPEVYWDAVRAIMHDNSYIQVNIRLDGGHPEYFDWLKTRFHDVTVTEFYRNEWNTVITVIAHKPV